MNKNFSCVNSREDLDKLSKKAEKFESKYKFYKSQTKELKALNHDLSQEFSVLNAKYHKLKNLSKKSPKFDPIASINQYDMIVKIDSLISANQKGWEIISKNHDKIKQWSCEEQIALGIIGRENLGKTWIVNKICKENFPSGYYCKTEGLSIKYCAEKNQQLKVLMDSAGMNGGIFFYDKSSLERYKTDKTKNEDFDKIRETMINDRSMTEYFIQNFILYSCNIIIVVVELLTQHDQKIIERIKHLYFEKKTIVIVHNFFKLELKDQVEKRAREEIKGAFLATEMIIHNTNVPYFIEKSEKKTNNNIIHVILGREGCESGDYFNEASLLHISSIIETESNIGKFDILNKLNRYWEEKNSIYFNMFKEEKKLPIFEKKSFENKAYFRLDFHKELLLKTPEFNVLGALKDFDVIYHLFEKTHPKREKIYYFELPGCKEKPEIVMKFNSKKNEQILSLTIKSEFDVPNEFKYVIGDNNLGNFVKKIKINDDYGHYECKKEFTKMENGLLKMKFSVKCDDETF